MVLRSYNQSQSPKIIGSARRLLFSSILLSIFAILLSGCGPGSETSTDNTHSQADEPTLDKEDETSERRTGTLTLTISIRQKLSKKVVKDLSVHNYASSYDHLLRLEQKVNIEQDFRYFETPAGSTNSEERLRYFNTRPFWKIKGEEPKLSGNLIYESLYRIEQPPSALGPLISETKIKGEAKPIRLKIEPVEPSQFGNGLALQLSWDFLGSQTKSTYVKHQSSDETNKVATDDEKEIEMEDWLFSPMPNDARINSYPFAHEYEGNQVLIDAAKKNTENTANFYQKLHEEGTDVRYFLGSVTHLNKDEMTIRYKETGRLIDQNHAFAFPAQPNLKNEIDVTLHVVAD